MGTKKSSIGDFLNLVLIWNNMINAFFDEKMEVRKGDRISILRGIETDTGIRITKFENLSSGATQKSRIND